MDSIRSNEPNGTLPKYQMGQGIQGRIRGGGRAPLTTKK